VPLGLAGCLLAHLFFNSAQIIQGEVRIIRHDWMLDDEHTNNKSG
jgi:hypothetical protein